MIVYIFYLIMVDKIEQNIKKIYSTLNMYCCQTYIFFKKTIYILL
jgi:hypothetical protein